MVADESWLQEQNAGFHQRSNISIPLWLTPVSYQSAIFSGIQKTTFRIFQAHESYL